MQTPSSAFVRLLSALEELAAQQDALLVAEDYAGLASAHERATPLVEELARLGAKSITPEIRPRLQALLERRERNQQELTARIAHTRDALLRTQSKQRFVAQVAPAYGRRDAAPVGVLGLG